MICAIAAGQLLPIRLPHDELLLSSYGESVVFEFAIAVCLPPGRDPAPALQPVQGWVKRAVLDLQHTLRGALDVLGDFVTMGGAKTQGSQNQHVECTLEQGNPV